LSPALVSGRAPGVVQAARIAPLAAAPARRKKVRLEICDSLFLCEFKFRFLIFLSSSSSSQAVQASLAATSPAHQAHPSTSSGCLQREQFFL
jgi:hypothetical protein